MRFMVCFQLSSVWLCFVFFFLPPPERYRKAHNPIKIVINSAPRCHEPFEGRHNHHHQDAFLSLRNQIHLCVIFGGVFLFFCSFGVAFFLYYYCRRHSFYSGTNNKLRGKNRHLCCMVVGVPPKTKAPMHDEKGNISCPETHTYSGHTLSDLEAFFLLISSPWETRSGFLKI